MHAGSGGTWVGEALRGGSRDLGMGAWRYSKTGRIVPWDQKRTRKAIVNHR